MNKYLKFLIFCILMFVMTYIFSLFYVYLFGTVAGSFLGWGPDNQEYFNGFLMAVSLLVPIFLIASASKSRVIWIIVFIVLLISFIVSLSAGNDLIVDSILIVLGLLIGELLARIFRNSNPTRPVDKKLGSKTKRVV